MCPWNGGTKMPASLLEWNSKKWIHREPMTEGPQYPIHGGPCDLHCLLYLLPNATNPSPSSRLFPAFIQPSPFIFFFDGLHHLVISSIWFKALVSVGLLVNFISTLYSTPPVLTGLPFIDVAYLTDTTKCFYLIETMKEPLTTKLL